MEHEEYRRRFHDFAYGMFIHYGLYASHARGEWVMSKERMTDEEYFKVLPQFKNNGELAEKWLSHNGEAVYKVTSHPFNYKDQEISTGHGSTVYIMLQADYLEPRRIICGIGNRIRKITLLEDRSDIAFRQEADKVEIRDI